MDYYMDITSLVAKLRELDAEATSGPWRNGVWRGQCHKNHIHAGKSSIYDPCKYEYEFVCEQPEHKRIICAGCPENPIELIGWGGYGPILNEANARAIAELRTLLPQIISALDGLAKG